MGEEEGVMSDACLLFLLEVHPLENPCLCLWMYACGCYVNMGVVVLWLSCLFEWQDTGHRDRKKKEAARST